MNTLLKVVFIGLSLTFISYNAAADGIFIKDKKIERIYPSGNEIRFRLKEDDCVNSPNYYYFEMNELDDGGIYASKNWYTMLLASAMAGKPISVSVYSCPTDSNVKVRYIFQDY